MTDIPAPGPRRNCRICRENCVLIVCSVTSRTRVTYFHVGLSVIIVRSVDEQQQDSTEEAIAIGLADSCIRCRHLQSPYHCDSLVKTSDSVLESTSFREYLSPYVPLFHLPSNRRLYIPSCPRPQSPMSYPRGLFPLFFCPLCSPSAYLCAPTTLRCGHTVCSAHITSSVCPIPTCSTLNRPGFSATNPASSGVAVFPAPLHLDQIPSTPTSPPRVDVRINNIVQFLRQTVEDAGKAAPSDEDPSEVRLWSPHTPSGPSLRNRSRPRSPSTAFDPPLSPLSPSRSISNFDKALAAELTCEICFMLLYQPITTPCQHVRSLAFFLSTAHITYATNQTFCSKCLQRSLDHSMLCPLCREDLPGFAYFQEHPHNKILLSLRKPYVIGLSTATYSAPVLKVFEDAYQSRGAAIEAEERHSRLDTPIFVCQLSFPGMPTLLHFFEPRYRLMLRRCLEGPSPTFGMTMPPRAAPLPGHGTNAMCEFGTMLEIRSVQMLPDGRSMVETWGTHRFRILESGTLDGYMIGRVERIDDYEDDLGEWAGEHEETPVPSSSSLTPPIVIRPPTLSLLTRISAPAQRSVPSSTSNSAQRSLTTLALMTACHSFLSQLRAGTAPWVVQRLNHTYGPQPPDSDPGAFSFWMGMVLPIEEHEKAKLLAVKSARLRLRMVVGWIEQLNSNWLVQYFDMSATVS